MTGSGRRRGLAVVVAAVVLALTAGCAQIPTDGAVHSGRELGYDQPDSYVRALPAAPRQGATPVEIVRGFLDASASFEDDYATARLFLSASARDSWEPDKGVTVYDPGTEMALTPGKDGHVTLNAPRLAAISAEGVYDPAPPGTKVTATFTVVKSDGQWRIGRLPDGLLLTDIDVSRSYRSVNVYFLDPQQQVLVPDPVFVPKSPGMSTTLVKRLLSGPSAWLRPGVTTAFPVGTALSGSVPVENGVAQVDLSDIALTAAPKAREALSAQLVWTLAQVEDVQAVRITVAGAPYSVRGAGDVQPRESWQGFDPSALPSDAQPMVLREHRLGTLQDGTFTPVPGPLGAGAVRLVDPAVDPKADTLAALSTDRTHLLVGQIGSAPEAQLTGGDLTAPSWDAVPTTWVADRSAPAKLWVVPRSGDPVAVQVPGLKGERITGVRVARDGTRIALVTGTGDAARLYVGAVARGDGHQTPARIEGLRLLATGITDITDVAWAEASRLALLGRQGGADPAVYYVDLDGEGVTAAPALPGVVKLAAAPSPLPLLAATADGQVYRLVGRRWAVAGAGSSPFYPG